MFKVDVMLLLLHYYPVLLSVNLNSLQFFGPAREEIVHAPASLMVLVVLEFDDDGKKDGNCHSHVSVQVPPPPSSPSFVGMMVCSSSTMKQERECIDSRVVSQ